MITPEERERAYERYELYRDARANWEMNTIINGFLMSLVVLLEATLDFHYPVFVFYLQSLEYGSDHLVFI